MHTQGLEHFRRRVDGEIIGRVQRGGGNQGHDGNQALGEHATEGYRANVAPFIDQFGRGAGTNEGVEAGDGTAGNGDGNERPDSALQDGASAIDEIGDRRELDGRVDEHHTHDQRGKDTDLHETGEITARRQQHPNRQGRGEEGINRQQPADRGLVQRQPVTEDRPLQMRAGGNRGNDGSNANVCSPLG